MSHKNVLISGASGMIGTALSTHLSAQGYTVYPLLRNRNDGPFCYLPDEGVMVFDSQIPLTAVINLAGANISDKRWNPQRKDELVKSRVETTRLLCETLAGLEHTPQVLLSGSAIGFYGPTGNLTANESSPPGTDFLARLAIEWEAANQPAIAAGIRTVNLRFGIVLSTQGGVLKEFLLPMNLAVAGAMGSGEQLISWISLNDAVNIIELAIDNSEIAGPINLVSNNSVSASEFSATLSRVSKRLKLPAIPAPIARLLFGEMADAALLASADIQSEKLIQLQYQWQHPSLELAFKHLLANKQ